MWKAKRVEAFIAVIVVKAYSTLSIRNRLSASSYACESRRANTFGNMCISPIMNLGHQDHYSREIVIMLSVDVCVWCYGSVSII